MKKLIPLMIIGIVLVSGLGAAVVPLRSNQPRIITLSEQFSSPIIQDSSEFVSISFDHMNGWFNQPGYPLIPALRKTITLPFGTTLQQVQVTFTGTHTTILPKPIQPGTQPAPLLNEHASSSESAPQPEVYASTTPIPAEDFWYTVGAGLDGLTHVFYLTLYCYPASYTPATRTLTWNDQVNIRIHTTAPTYPVLFGNQSDLLLIAPSKFSAALQPLITHKEAMGVRTMLKTVEDITSNYQGRDKPEKIKYAIKDMIEAAGIHYVLLVGGIKNFIYATARDDANQGTKDWWVPVRYTNLYDGGSIQDSGCISDLYYADIYNGTGGFSSWDSNNNNVFAEWVGSQKDIIDLYPDVYVGRLACDNTREVNTMVKKMVTYEKTKADPSWFNTMVVIGSDTFDDGPSGYLEGEVENQKALDYMAGFTPVKIWGTHRNTSGLVPVPKDIVTTISAGAGFVYFSGHGSAERWNTYWPHSFQEKRARGIYFYNIPFIHNREKLPVIVVGGCHNSQFNVTMTGYLTGTPFIYSPVPECFSWLFDRNTRGGAIATFGNTGLGYGATGNSGDLDGDGVNDPDCVEARGGYLETQFFKAYGVNHTEILGACWGAALTKYLTVYPGMHDKLDCKTVQEWVLLGDPSLMIGGYAR